MFVLLVMFAIGARAGAAPDPLFGPAFPLPAAHGGSTCQATSGVDGAIGKTGGQTWSYGSSGSATTCPVPGVNPTPLAAFDPALYKKLYWGIDATTQATSPGLQMNGGPIDAGAILQFSPGLSSLANGKLVWLGSTTMNWCNPGNCPNFQSSAVDTELTITVTHADNSPFALTDATTVGAGAEVGGVADITGGTFKVNMLFTANFAGSGATIPALEFYNSFNHPPGEVVFSSVTAGFRWTTTPPTGDFGIGTITNHQPVTLTATGVTDDAALPPDATLYAWDTDNDGNFDNGNSSTVSPTFGPGTHTVKLRLTDSDGVTTVVSHDVVVPNQNPTIDSAGCTPAHPLANQTVDCDVAATDPDPPLNGTVTYDWDLDNNGTFETAGAHVTPSFATPGAHTVTARATDADGGVTTQDVVVTVDTPPTAAIGTITAQNHKPFSFAVTANDADGTIASYQWDLGDGTGKTGETTAAPSATYGPGQHTVSVTVTDNFGAVATDTKQFTITNADPVADFSCAPNPATVGATITCTAADSDPDGVAGDTLTELWSFAAPGDKTGPTASGTLPLGAHTISLKVTDRDGGQKSVSHDVTVNNAVTPTPTPSPTATPPGGNFTASLTVNKLVRRALKGGVKGSITASSAGSADLAVALAAKVAKKLRLKNPIAKATVALKAGPNVFTLKLSKKAAKKLQKVRKFTLVIAGTASDGAGHTVKLTNSVSVKK